jgi:hypothetical protein
MFELHRSRKERRIYFELVKFWNYPEQTYFEFSTNESYFHFELLKE